MINAIKLRETMDNSLKMEVEGSSIFADLKETIEVAASEGEGKCIYITQGKIIDTNKIINYLILQGFNANIQYPELNKIHIKW